MALDADAIVARRQLKRQLGIWRIVAVVLLVVLVTATAYEANIAGRPHIARLPVYGTLYGDTTLLEAVDRLREDSSVKAVIIDIDSPGGGSAAAEELYAALRKLAVEKPVVSMMRSVAASGGYIVAIAGDRILARGNTITGSIGVIFQSFEVSELLDTVGVKVEEVKSGPLKAEPSGLAPMSPAARAAVEATVRDTFDWFVDLVAERRGLPRPEVERLADGRVYTGRQALTERLIDELGGEEEAVAWLAKAKGVDGKLDVVPVTFSPMGFDLGAMAGTAASTLVRKVLKSERVTLDGLVSLWHASPR